jgi:hypothetical protein
MTNPLSVLLSKNSPDLLSLVDIPDAKWSWVEKPTRKELEDFLQTSDLLGRYRNPDGRHKAFQSIKLSAVHLGLGIFGVYLYNGMKINPLHLLLFVSVCVLSGPILIFQHIDLLHQKTECLWLRIHLYLSASAHDNKVAYNCTTSKQTAELVREYLTEIPPADLADTVIKASEHGRHSEI